MKTADNPFFVIFHPFDASYEIRRRDRGKYSIAIVILILWFLISVMERQNTGYIFNYNKRSELNSILQLIKVILPFLMWASGNWIVSILMNGTGRFRDIFIYSAYCAVPHMLAALAAVGLSNVLAKNEPFADYVSFFGTAWSLILLFIGTMIMHEFRFLENIAACLFSVGVMAIILFLMMLLGNLYTEFSGFLQTIYREILFRL